MECGVKPPSKAMITKLAKRLIRIGIPPWNNSVLSDRVMGSLAIGEILLVVKRGPKTCNCCDKPMLTVFVCPKTKKPLGKLFSKETKS
jgi:hypothetical protein